MEDKVCCSCH